MSAHIWDGEPVKTIGDLLDTACAAVDRGRAAEYLATYRAANPEHADANLGYVIGYVEPAERRRALREALGLVLHPIFGGRP